MVEIWKDIVGYEGMYKVSNLGNVMSFWGKTPKLLKPAKAGKGYLVVLLSNNKYIKQFYLHRLVAQAFLPNPNNYPIINHKDENKLNNNVENLEWCSYQYNTTYGTAQDRRAKKLTNRKDQSNPVLQYDKNGNFINEYHSIQDAERNTGISHQNISNVCRGKQKSAGNYIWKYKQPLKIT